MAFTYQSSRGRLCYLHRRLTNPPSGLGRCIYYFAYAPQAGQTVDELPPGYVIAESYKTGFPVLRKCPSAGQ